MRIRMLLVVLAATVLVAGSAGAATYAYTGVISFGLGTLPSATSAGTPGNWVNPTPHISTITLPAIGPITTSVPVTADSTIQSVRLSAVGNLSGTITGVSGGPPLGSGTVGMSGIAKICLFFDAATCSYGPVVVPLTQTAATGLGIGGTQYVAGAVNLTMQHAPWTVGAWSAMTIHDAASVVSTPTLPSGFAAPASSTANGGVLQLVSVTKVFTSLTTSFPELPVFAIMNLQFEVVPEPGTLLLLGSGVVGLAILGRSRKS